ncbi:MAG: dephospho-CoA kinase [Phycisphaerae bacterium]|jgi:dephospho-CoA kinase|nr:dephospho-CoA kinase [Phycisphaerae bacterium]
MNSPPIIGIIGGIGSGKSTIANIMGELGCIVADADANIAIILQQKDVQEQLTGWWGDAINSEDGLLDRQAIADIVFRDDSERVRLEDLLHPLARKMQEKQFSVADSSTKALIIDAPLLIESGLDVLCDAIIFVDVPFETRKARVLQSRNWTEQELQSREATQYPLDKKRKRADYVVINEGDLGAVTLQVKKILDEIRRQLA